MTKQLELIAAEPPRPGLVGRLDERTKQVGRVGLSQARAALAESSRRATERQAARVARRDDELAQRAAAARSAAVRREQTPGETRSTEAA